MTFFMSLDVTNVRLEYIRHHLWKCICRFFFFLFFIRKFPSRLRSCCAFVIRWETETKLIILTQYKIIIKKYVAFISVGRISFFFSPHRSFRSFWNFQRWVSTVLSGCWKIPVRKHVAIGAFYATHLCLKTKRTLTLFSVPFLHIELFEIFFKWPAVPM